MKTIVKHYTALLAFLFFVAAVIMATYLSSVKPPNDAAFWTACAIALLAGLLAVHAIGLGVPKEDLVLSRKGLQTVEIAPSKIVYIGTKNDFLAQGALPEVEMVSLAAMTDYYGIIYAGQAPIDHATIRKWYNSQYSKPICQYGWITNTGRYVSEEEGWDIALKAKQLHQNSRSNGYLTAEEIWPNVYQKAA
jgi:hypothetical protein